MFDGTLGQWRGKDFKIELKEGVKPYYSRPYPVPKIHEETMKKECARMEKLGILRKSTGSEWGAPTFIVPKKNNTVRFISDFRELNKRIKRKPYPIPKIQDLLLKLEGFRYATSLDLSMGYYHIQLHPDSRKLCTIVLPWGKYEYVKLPMGLCNSPDIFQERMNDLFDGLAYVRAYIDDLLIMTNGTWEDHLEKVGIALRRLQKAGLKVNAEKSFFGHSELEYLGYWVTRNGIMPLPKKVDAIKNIATPKTKKQLRSFIGIINYYRDMWVRRSEILAPLTNLTSKDAKWEWTDVHQQAFDKIKKLVSKETLLSFPDFSKRFDIHTDASHTQLGAVISQNNKPIAFYSRKLNPAQTRYTTTERELLAIVETLKEFRNILLGHEIRVCTAHKNLTYKTQNTERVMRWRLLIEEFSPDLVYLQGEKNIVADALSRLDIDPDDSPDKPNDLYLAENFAVDDDDEPPTSLPFTYKSIMREQSKDNKLKKLIKSYPNRFKLKKFHGGGTVRNIVTVNLGINAGKIVVPESLQLPLTEWYHNTLCHPGETRTEMTIKQHFWWRGLTTTVRNVCSKCVTCQTTKRTHNSKYGQLPAKEAEAEPWDKLCVDLIGPYKFKQPNSKKDVDLWCATMIDPATGWIEIAEIPDKRADTVADVIERTWFNRYPWPTQVVMDRGSEFMAEFSEMVVRDYGVKKKTITTRNPQANAIVERVHQTIGNVIRTMELYDQELDQEEPFKGVISATCFAIRSTVHTTTQHTPMQLVFGRDAILNIAHEANWKLIKDRKQKLIDQNNKRENASRKPHTYNVGDKVLIKNDWSAKYRKVAFLGPYPITNVNDNGTVRVALNDTVTDVYNIRYVRPFRE